MMPEIHSCWWCGKSDCFQVLPQIDEDPELRSVMCTMCSAAGPDAKGERAAINKWNEGPKFVKVKL